ncbi:hypothetical protein LTR56_004860 [Elasticomyces elasticus]|nr:hypothetical protein LTR56_004860 [Elasticomyces elasticus]KAK3664634.1 hypothetical protein LTR22_004502 [Elasticomyces elasticus]KAK4918398.1 hypothetical protein LTR49_013790 [Elasticomyces elasticus]KAK5760344.1 hypothetical protein LTS12_009558 [Elasticomyces elasticus]
MKIGVYGATGYTGRLIVAELVHRDISTLILGRNEQDLASVPGPVQRQVAGLDDIEALSNHLQGCDTVISCVSPFSQLGFHVLEAAILARCNYIDTSGEQRWIQRVFEEYGPRAAAAGIVCIPSATDDTVTGDLIAGLVAKRLDTVESLVVHHGFFDVDMSRGTMKSFYTLMQILPLVWRERRWMEQASSALGNVRFPAADDEQASFLFPGAELIGMQRHLTANKMHATVNIDLVSAMTGLDEDVIATLPKGPAVNRRGEARLTMLVEATSPDGQMARGYARGRDLYKLTATVAVEAAIRCRDVHGSRGVLAPSEAFDAESFLNDLRPFGVDWYIDV